jgi:putative endonuclease
MRTPSVYILASKRNGTLYVGVTSEPIQRVWKHKNGGIEGFTKQYGVKLLVYLEVHTTMSEAISREKQIKKWRRASKVGLIQRHNPKWHDLYDEISGVVAPAGFPLSRG